MRLGQESGSIKSEQRRISTLLGLVILLVVAFGAIGAVYAMTRGDAYVDTSTVSVQPSTDR